VVRHGGKREEDRDGCHWNRNHCHCGYASCKFCISCESLRAKLVFDDNEKDLEIELTLEALRIKAVKDGAGPMPAHKAVAQNIAKTHNQFGAQHENRKKWITSDIKVTQKADLLYFVGCSAS
jgi:hypothetical protein